MDPGAQAHIQEARAQTEVQVRVEAKVEAEVEAKVETKAPPQVGSRWPRQCKNFIKLDMELDSFSKAGRYPNAGVGEGNKCGSKGGSKGASELKMEAKVEAKVQAKVGTKVETKTHQRLEQKGKKALSLTGLDRKVVDLMRQAGVQKCRATQSGK